MEYSFHWKPVIRALPDLIDAALVTLEVSVLSIAIGIIIGLALFSIRDSKVKVLSYFAKSWISLARNTPALFQLFFFGFGLGAFGLHLSPYLIVLAGLSFNNAGYLAEIFRGGMNAIPQGQERAAITLGMKPFQSFRYIILPQLFRAVYHPMTNQFVWAVLMSSLGMLVGFRELTGETQFFASKTYRIFEYFMMTAIIYYVIIKAILISSKVLSYRLFKWS